MNLYLIPDGVDDCRQRLNGTQRPIQLPTAMVRDDDRVCPDLERHLRISDIHNTFENYLPVPFLYDTGDFFPIKRGVELLSRPSREAGGIAHAFGMPDNIAKKPPLCS